MSEAPPVYRLRQGRGPLLVSIPHAGTYVPPPIKARMTPAALALADTDWHVDRLYGFTEAMDATILIATHSRYVVDLNRGPDGAPLYPGQAETGIVPRESFAGESLWRDPAPDAGEIASRIELYWQPYHFVLAEELARLRALHGSVRLFDAHSIRSQVPRLFEGILPELSFGTNGGKSAEASVLAAAIRAAGASFGTVCNGRFSGGYITRQYGRPETGIQSLQLEIAQCAYLDEADPASWNPDRAAPLLAVLRRILTAIMNSALAEPGTRPAADGF